MAMRSHLSALPADAASFIPVLAGPSNANGLYAAPPHVLVSSTRRCPTDTEEGASECIFECTSLHGVRISQGSLLVTPREHLVELRAATPALSATHSGTTAALPCVAARLLPVATSPNQTESFYFWRGHQCIAAHQRPLPPSRRSTPAPSTAMLCVAWEDRNYHHVGVVYMPEAAQLTLVAASTPQRSEDRVGRPLYTTGHVDVVLTQADITNAARAGVDPLLGPPRPAFHPSGPTNSSFPVATLLLGGRVGLLQVTAHSDEERQAVRAAAAQRAAQRRSGSRRLFSRSPERGSARKSDAAAPTLEELCTAGMAAPLFDLPQLPVDAATGQPAQPVQLLWSSASLLWVRYATHQVQAFAVTAAHDGTAYAARLLHTFSLLPDTIASASARNAVAVMAIHTADSPGRPAAALRRQGGVLYAVHNQHTGGLQAGEITLYAPHDGDAAAAPVPRQLAWTAAGTLTDYLADICSNPGGAVTVLCRPRSGGGVDALVLPRPAPVDEALDEEEPPGFVLRSSAERPCVEEAEARLQALRRQADARLEALSDAAPPTDAAGVAERFGGVKALQSMAQQLWTALMQQQMGGTESYPCWLAHHVQAHRTTALLYHWILQLEERVLRAALPASTTAAAELLGTLHATPLLHLCPPAHHAEQAKSPRPMMHVLLEEVRQWTRQRGALPRTPQASGRDTTAWTHALDLGSVCLHHVLGSGPALFGTSDPTREAPVTPCSLPPALAVLVLYATLAASYAVAMNRGGGGKRSKGEVLRRLVTRWVEEQVGCPDTESWATLDAPAGDAPLVLTSWLLALNVPPCAAHVAFLCFAADAGISPADLTHLVDDSSETGERVACWLRTGPSEVLLSRGATASLRAALLRAHWLGTEAGVALRECAVAGLEGPTAAMTSWKADLEPTLRLAPLPPPLRAEQTPGRYDCYRELLEAALLSMPSFTSSWSGASGPDEAAARTAALRLYAASLSDASAARAAPNLAGLLRLQAGKRSSDEEEVLASAVRHSAAVAGGATGRVSTPTTLLWLLQLHCACRRYTAALAVCDTLLSCTHPQPAAAQRDRLQTVRAALVSLLPCEAAEQPSAPAAGGTNWGTPAASRSTAPNPLEAGYGPSPPAAPGCSVAAPFSAAGDGGDGQGRVGSSLSGSGAARPWAPLLKGPTPGGPGSRVSYMPSQLLDD